MSVLVKATPAPAPRTKESRQMAILLAAIFVVFAVGQLFTFDEFIEVVPNLGLPFGALVTASLAPIVVAAEVFALPFLLGMKVSIAFRWLSMLLGWFVAGFWLFVSIWTAATNQAIETIGFLGTVVQANPGWWAVCIAVALAILTAWASWGLWPGKRSRS